MKQKLISLVRKKLPDGILAWNESSRIIGFNFSANNAGVDRCLDFIVKNFFKTIRLRDLAVISGMSRRRIYLAFRKSVGMGPGVVLRYVRIEYAKRLLAENDLTLRQVAQLSGYHSENTFCVAFQREVKISPKVFQKQQLMETYRDPRPNEIERMIPSPMIPWVFRGNMPARLLESKNRSDIMNII
jgi:AraC-like DNA-binding protein